MTCHGCEKTDCNTCYDPRYLLKGMCVEECDDNQYLNMETGDCECKIFFHSSYKRNCLFQKIVARHA